MMPPSAPLSSVRLRDEVIEVLQEVVGDHPGRLAAASDHRISCEGWLKIELLHALGRHFSNEPIQVQPEEDYVDLTLAGPDARCLVELKTFPTNYGGGGKPITNFIDGVVADLEKLAEKIGNGGRGLAVWLAYPLPSPEPHPWNSHVGKVQSAAASTLLDRRLEVRNGDGVGLYVMESEPSEGPSGAAER